MLFFKNAHFKIEKRRNRKGRKIDMESIMAPVEQKEIVIGEREIMEILPHRGRMVLLDEVIINADRVTGSFLVTKEVCEGHAVLNGGSVLRGSDILDMAAQLLGVWTYNHFRCLRGCMVREYGGAKFLKTISPGERLTLEITAKDIEVDDSGERGGRWLIFVTGKNFLAKVESQTRAKIFSVKLVIL